MRATRRIMRYSGGALRVADPRRRPPASSAVHASIHCTKSSRACGYILHNGQEVHRCRLRKNHAHLPLPGQAMMRIPQGHRLVCMTITPHNHSTLSEPYTPCAARAPALARPVRWDARAPATHALLCHLSPRVRPLSDHPTGVAVALVPVLSPHAELARAHASTIQSPQEFSRRCV